LPKDNGACAAKHQSDAADILTTIGQQISTLSGVPTECES